MSKAIATTTNILSGDRVNVQLSWMKEDFQFSYASTQLNFVPKSAQRILMEHLTYIKWITSWFQMR
jgi:hypothetical protein